MLPSECQGQTPVLPLEARSTPVSGHCEPVPSCSPAPAGRRARGCRTWLAHCALSPRPGRDRPLATSPGTRRCALIGLHVIYSRPADCRAASFRALAADCAGAVCKCAPPLEVLTLGDAADFPGHRDPLCSLLREGPALGNHGCGVCLLHRGQLPVLGMLDLDEQGLGAGDRATKEASMALASGAVSRADGA